jgi:hypothetical protein
VAAVASTLVALVALVASRAGLSRLSSTGAARDPHAYWALGLVTLLPAWLIAFLALLGSTPEVRMHFVTGAAWTLSSAAGLVMAIATEARARAAGETVTVDRAPRLWRLGVLALLPAWLIALAGSMAG